jgi:hypothetical protein
MAHPDPQFTCDLESSCSRSLERSIESTDPLSVLVSLTDPTKGGGWTMTLMQCLRDNQCVSCLTPPPGEAGADPGDSGASSEGSFAPTQPG